MTHPDLTKYALTNSVAHENIQISLGLINTIDETNLTATLWNGEKDETATKTILEWFQYGSQMEDTPACRAGNHFFDPSKAWDAAGLTDYEVSLMSKLVMEGYCDWPVTDIRSNLTWTTRFKSPGVKDNFSVRPIERQP